MHNLKISHGNLRPSSILFSDSFWGWLSLSNMRIIRGRLNTEGQPSPSSSIGCCIDNCPCQTIHTDLKLSASMDWRSNFIKWWKGELSNYEYLLILNKLAGRRWGDHTFHTVMPWVIDFSVKPDENCDTGWRDLKKSKWRLAKGDEQLDFTYLTSEVPHHVSDECLSELAVCSYKARRLPLKILCSAVRSVYEPNEYPSNMQRLYQWTPDECIPEFYSDPQMFFSIHSEMCDLAVPSWSSSPEEFISLHRNALESDRVSRDIHHWIDITFGYKLSGEASILAKNVMLLASDPSIPKSTGRRQLFTNPHPMRQAVKPYSGSNGNREANVGLQNQLKESMMNSNSKDSLRTESGYLEKLEEAMSFCDVARYLDPIYSCDENFVKFPYVVPHKFYPELDCLEKRGENSLVPSDFGFGHLLEFFDCNDNSFTGFQKLLHWKHLSSSGSSTEDLAGDIFSMGCIIAELYLRKPLFDPISFSAYHENGLFPAVMQELPPSVAVIVEAAICRDWKRRLSAICLLESPFFPPSVRAVYLFVAPLQHLSSPGYRLQYAAKLANGGALKALGTHATEMCASYTLPLIMSAFSDAETESALFLLKEFLKCLSFQAIEALLLPTIQKILQASEYSHLKVSILQESFIRDLWKHLGKHAYLEGFHPLVISNFYNAPSKVSASVASVVLIGSSEELGIPITVHQTVLPLMHYFGKGLSADGIDALVRIGGVLGENFIVRQLLPLLRNIVFSCIEASHMNKPEPVRSWIALALIDSFAFLEGLVSLLSPELILRELTQDQNCLYIKVLLQDHLDLPVIQASATALISVCQRIGSECTASYVLPLMKKVFDELSFTRPTNFEADSSGNRSGISQSMPDENFEIGNRLDLVCVFITSLFLYLFSVYISNVYICHDLQSYLQVFVISFFCSSHWNREASPMLFNLVSIRANS
ncbi:hypothetical protein AXF42_Ash001673 [Apostasia shenzhenica]|uniref:BEACH domain-containing protein n=1 Tax=Apostasia shenzhenica TaxID=1088818 RepID=A0A2I0AAX8_9ASPA|nr:hypothetical protein AXF42_Ash001673 [Apostasia shenzhenica]